MLAVPRLADVVEEPLRAAGRVIHPRLSSAGLDGLDPDVARVVSLAGPIDTSRLPAPVMRTAYRLQTVLWNRPRETDLTVEDRAVNEHVTVRTYTPHVERGGGLVYFHGGGMMIGDLATHDRWCRWVAVRSGMVVHAVDYRLAPEHPYPAGCLDALAAWNHVVAGWQAQGRSLDRLGVGGDSAGGYLAAVVATQAVSPTLGAPVAAPPAFQWLIYPAVDAVRRPETFTLYPEGVLLTGGVVERFTDVWLAAGDPADAAHSPGLVPDEVAASLPTTHLTTCEFDPLTPECLRFRDRLRSLDVTVDHEHLDDLPHDFIALTGVAEAAERAAARIIDALAALA